MGSEIKRRTFAVGGSTCIALPKPWLDYHGKACTKEVTLFGNSILIVAPKGKEKQAKRIIRALEKSEKL